MQSVVAWDPLVRLFHWSTAFLFLANVLFIDEDSAAHLYIGYGLFGLVLIRLIWGLVGSQPARFSAFRPSWQAVRAHLQDIIAGRPDRRVSHNPLGALMVYNLLAALIAISVTGIMMTLDSFWGVDWLEGLHEGLTNYALLSVGLHVAGVLFESKRSKVNLIGAMVTGRKDFPTTDT